MDEFGLKDLIRQTRLEIEAAAREREEAGETGLFQVDSVTIEANFVVRKSGEGSAGVKFLAVTLDGGAKYEKEQVQKVTVVLSPVKTLVRGGASGSFVDDGDQELLYKRLLQSPLGPMGSGLSNDLRKRVLATPDLIVLEPNPLLSGEGLGFQGITGVDDSGE